MEIAVLGSGSGGNATLVRSGNTMILLEAGLSSRQIVARARYAGYRPERISAVFVSHAHADHVKGAPVFSRRHRVPVFMTDGAHERWRESRAERARWFGRLRRGVPAAPPSVPAAVLSERPNGLEPLAEGWGHRPTVLAADRTVTSEPRAWGYRASEPADHGREADLFHSVPPPSRDRDRGAFYAHVALQESGVVEIGSLRVRTFPVPHDTDGTIGYVVEAEGMRFGYVTDLGHVTALVAERLRGCDALLIEMNHDPDLLREGPYPWSVKQRIASRHGHLSNEQGANLLEQSIGSDTRCILLGHLSETNNQPGIAFSSARLAVERAGRGDLRIVPAEQHRPLKGIRL